MARDVGSLRSWERPRLMARKHELRLPRQGAESCYRPVQQKKGSERHIKTEPGQFLDFNLVRP